MALLLSSCAEQQGSTSLASGEPITAPVVQTKTTIEVEPTTQAEPTSAPNFSLVGFAAMPGHGMNGTTGGGDAAATTVKTLQEFQSAVERLDIKDKKLRDNSPRVVLVAADIDLGELANEKPGTQIKSVGKVRVYSNTTIYSTGEGATIRRGVLDIKGAQNVIIRHLRFRDLWEDPTGKYNF